MFTREILFHQSPLKPLQQVTLLRQLFPQREMSGEFDGGECLLVWLAHLLKQLSFLQDEQVTFLLSELRQPVRDLGRKLAETIVDYRTHCISTFQLVFCDWQYTTWTGRIGFVSLETGEPASLPRPPMVDVAINVDEVFRRGVVVSRQTLQLLQEREHADRDVSETSDP